MKWRIRDGKSIDIYSDNWLSGEGSSKIISPRVPKLEGVKVFVLISLTTSTWDQNLLYQHFINFQAQHIMAIPLCMTH